jgi:hypothetical protein
MTIRDINIYNSKGKKLRNWLLYKHNENEVYDEIKQDKAIVHNGIWEIDKHVEWKPEMKIPIYERNAQISYDSSNNKIFIATSDSLLIYNINNWRLDHIKTLKGRYAAAMERDRRIQFAGKTVGAGSPFQTKHLLQYGSMEQGNATHRNVRSRHTTTTLIQWNITSCPATARLPVSGYANTVRQS